MSKSNVLIKKALARAVHKRLNKVTTFEPVEKAINILIEALVQEFLKNNSVSINKFGTFSPFKFKGHIGFNVNIGKLAYVNDFISIKFRTHSAFKQIINNKRGFFKKG